MRKIILLVIGLVIPICSFAESVILNWSPPNNTNVVGYNIFYGEGTSSNCFTSKIIINNGGTTNYFIPDLIKEIVYSFAITAINSDGQQSDFSQLVSCLIPLDGPINTMDIASYRTNWYAVPLLSTNRFSSRITTNYFSVMPYTFTFHSDSYITNWCVQKTTNLLDWDDFLYGSNSVPTFTITNTECKAFFRLKF